MSDTCNEKMSRCSNDPKFIDRWISANSVDPDQRSSLIRVFTFLLYCPRLLEALLYERKGIFLSRQIVLKFVRLHLLVLTLLHQDNMSVYCIPPYHSLLYSKTGVYRGILFFLIFAPKHRLWVLVRTA